jgi:hypothetical protein
MNPRPIHRYLLKGLQVIIVVGTICAGVLGQEAKTSDQLPAAPPMRAIPPAERNQLNEARDSKARIRLTVELSDTHLQRAEAAAAQQRYDPALTELGIYLGLIEDGFRFLAQLNSDRGKTRDLYKRIELALRAHGPRLTVMRRSTPLEYATRMKEVEDFARDGRTDALNAFYGHTVVRDGKPKKPEEENKPKDAPDKPEREP